MAKIKPKSRVLQRICKNKRPGKLRESRATRRTASSNSWSQKLSAIWHRSTSTIDDNSDDGSMSSHRPSLFSCFKKSKKRNKSTERSVDREKGRGGRQLLVRLMSSFLHFNKKNAANKPEYTQPQKHEEDQVEEGINNELTNALDNALNVGGITITVELEPVAAPDALQAADDAMSPVKEPDMPSPVASLSELHELHALRATEEEVVMPPVKEMNPVLTSVVQHDNEVLPTIANTNTTVDASVEDEEEAQDSNTMDHMIITFMPLITTLAFTGVYFITCCLS